MKHCAAAPVVGLVLAITLLQQGPPPTPAAPLDVASVGTIAGAAEPGSRLSITGQVFAPDGITPAAGVIVYAYQTDANGEYRNDPARIARLHGWARTDSEGHYEFRTIRPGRYPGRSVPAHIHFHIYGGGYPLQWTPELMFADDPLLQAGQVESSAALGKFANVQAPVRASDGSQQCTFNIRARSSSNYPPGIPSMPQ